MWLLRRILPHEPAGGLAQQVGVADVPGVLVACRQRSGQRLVIGRLGQFG